MGARWRGNETANRHAVMETGGKVKRPVTRPCQRCGTDIPTTGGKRYCLPCYGVRYEENIAANRHRYRKPKAP